MADGDPELWDKPGLFHCSAAAALLLILAATFTRMITR